MWYFIVGWKTTCTWAGRDSTYCWMIFEKGGSVLLNRNRLFCLLYHLYIIITKSFLLLYGYRPMWLRQRAFCSSERKKSDIDVLITMNFIRKSAVTWLSNSACVEECVTVTGQTISLRAFFSCCLRHHRPLTPTTVAPLCQMLPTSRTRVAVSAPTLEKYELLLRWTSRRKRDEERGGVVKTDKWVVKRGEARNQEENCVVSVSLLIFLRTCACFIIINPTAFLARPNPTLPLISSRHWLLLHNCT